MNGTKNSSVQDLLDDTSTDMSQRATENTDKFTTEILTPEDIAEFYKKWSSHYEEEYLAAEWNGPRVTVEGVCDFVPDKSLRKYVRIIDIGAGTGFVGAMLHSSGFENVDGLEPSEGMIAKLKTKNVYKKIYMDTMGFHKTEIPDNYYDIVTVCGAFIQGHLPLTAYDEFIRIVKPGGLIVNTMRHEYLQTVEEYHDMDQYISELEKQGLFKQTSKEVFKNYFQGKDGIRHTFIKIKSKE